MSITTVILSILGLLSLIEIVILIRAAGRANEADWDDSFSNKIDGLNRLFVRKFHRLKSDHVELPEEGPAIVVANHISGLDPLLLMASCKRPLHFLIAQKEYDRPGLKWLFDMAGTIPVEKKKRPERALRIALRALEEGKVIALFPYGRIHLDSDPPIRIKGGVGVLASRSGAAVYPVRIESVAGKGSVVRAVIRRGHPKLYPLDPVHVGEDNIKGMLEKLSAVLSTPINENT